MQIKQTAIATAVASVMALGLSACGGSSSSSDTTTTTQEDTSAATQEDTSAATQEAASAADQGTSSTVTGIDTTVTYKGAFSSTEHTSNKPNSTAWTSGWTVGIHGNDTVWTPKSGVTADKLCPEGTTYSSELTVATGVTMDVCQLAERYTSDVHLTNNNVYITKEGTPGTKVGNGDKNTDRDFANVTITIDKGTLILGGAGEALTITRGSKISAIGTKDDPIVMASLKWFKDKTIDERATWGGLVLMGQAKAGECANADYAKCNVFAEGGVGYFGGDNDADNSGELKYIVIRGAGYDLDGKGNELNALTMMATGTGTKVSYVQTHRTGDDGIEHFGAADFMHHIVMTDIGDDGFDWGNGFTGSAQFGYITMAKDYKASDSRGFEGDNSKGSAGDGTKTIFPGLNGGSIPEQPISNPTLRNFTMYGDMTYSDSGILLRRGTKADMKYIVVDNFEDECVEIRDRGTVEDATAQDKTTGALTFSGTYNRIKLTDSEFGTCGTHGRTVDFTNKKDDLVTANAWADDAAKTAAEAAWISAQSGNTNLKQ